MCRAPTAPRGQWPEPASTGTVYERHGLREGEFDVLAALRRSGEPYELAPHELAEHAMVPTAAMTKRLDRLVAAGWVTRSPSVVDGRRRVVGLTRRGRQLIDRAFTEHIANEHRLLDDLSPRQALQLEALLISWIRPFEAGPDFK
jgi:DNA-binding MarR family transcriptional regulator